MKTIKILIATTLKLHRYLLSIGLMLLYAYAGLINYALMFKGKDVGDALQLSSFLIQSGMLFFILLGFRIARKTTVEETLQQIVKRKITAIHLFNVVFLLFIAIFYVLTMMAFNLIYYYWMDPYNSFGLESSLFLINYWLLPFCTSSLIGYIFGMNSSNKIAYALLLIIWASISPANLNFLRELFANTQLQEAMEWLKNLNFGVYNLSDLYHPFYGFEFDWLKKIGLLLLLVFVYVLSIFTVNIKCLRRFNLVMIILGLILFGSMPYDFVKPKIYDVKTLVQEYISYSKKENIPKANLFEYDIEGMDVKVENFDHFNVSVDVRVTKFKKTELAFTLYRGFRINKIMLSSGREVPFVQKGDHIIVKLSEKLNMDSVTLTFTYSGKGSLSNPAMGKYIYLPSDFGWLPSNQPYAVRFLFNDEFITSSLKNKNKIKYTLSYKGIGKPTFVNLPKTSDGKYAGNTTGITLISGDLVHVKRDKRTMYYPVSWFLYKEELESYLNEYQKVLEKYNGIFKTNYKLPNNIILLPNMDINDTYIYINSFSDSDHIILQINPVEFTKKMPINHLVPYQIDRTFSTNNTFNNPKKFANWFIYNSLLGSYLSDKPKDSIQALKDYQMYLAESYLDEKSKVILAQLLKIDEKKLPDELFVRWKDILLDEDKNDWKQIEKTLLQLGQVQIIV
jgi:hypothetical protein